ncbi:MAG: glycosyltransferase [Parafilimonas sp.]|nr:glycosyltransferase [Parafilimonas sp.]
MQLSIIIVNYYAEKYIADCLNSAAQFSSYKTFEWIIINNCPFDKEKHRIENIFTFIKWIDMHNNTGFARANNAGIKAATGDVVLLLNPDTIVVDDCIYKCFQRFKNDEAIACSVQLLNADQTPQITGNYFMKGGLNHLLPLPYMGSFLRKIAFIFNAKKTNVLSASARQKVDWINGAFLMVKKEAIENAGLMDEDFFLYAEESEWCSRLKKFGELVVYGDLNILHLQGEIINAKTNSADKGYFNLYDKKGLQLIISNNLRIRKQFGVAWYLLNLLFYIIEIPIFFFCSFFNNLIHLKNPFNDWQQLKGFSKNVFVLIELTPTIIKNKNHFYKMI